METKKQLRFAPLIRVSTENQETKGESLRTQRKQILQYVQILGGSIPENAWQYSGQEHATPDQERTKLDKLLADAAKGMFDAVIVCDASRWSRDNLKSKKGLEVLMDNNIQFFIGTMQYDLFNPEHRFFLGMSAEIGEYQSRTQALKSIINRIERAKRGIPSAGRLPYGRTFSEEKGWGVDEDKKELIQKCAKRYLSGEMMCNIAKTVGMNHASLWKNLTRRSGEDWECSFVSKKLNVEEIVNIKIPRLLDQNTINAIHAKAEANKTYHHGELKHHYLLSRMIFCADCGRTLFGYTNRNGLRYYRHQKHKECKFSKFLPADEVEIGTLINLITMFGDKDRIKKAIARATPDLSKLEGLQQEMEDLQKELKRIAGQKGNIIDMVADGVLKKDEVTAKIQPLRDREEAINQRVEMLQDEISSIPSADHVNTLSKMGIKVLSNAIKNNPKAALSKPYEWKRKMVEQAFTGKNAKKERLGVYVKQLENSFEFEIRGNLESAIIGLPLSDEFLADHLHIDNEAISIKTNSRLYSPVAIPPAHRSP